MPLLAIGVNDGLPTMTTMPSLLRARTCHFCQYEDFSNASESSCALILHPAQQVLEI